MFANPWRGEASGQINEVIVAGGKRERERHTDEKVESECKVATPPVKGRERSGMGSEDV